MQRRERPRDRGGARVGSGNGQSGGGVSAATRLRQAERLLVRRTSDAVVVLGTHEEATILRTTAAEVWDAFAQERAVAEVMDSMAARYGVPGTDVSRDVLPFIEELVAKDLLVVHQPIASSTDGHAVIR